MVFENLLLVMSLSPWLKTGIIMLSTGLTIASNYCHDTSVGFKNCLPYGNITNDVYLFFLIRFDITIILIL